MRTWAMRFAAVVTIALLASSMGSASAQTKLPKATKPAVVKPLHTWKGFSDWTTAVAYAPDGKTIAIGTYDKLELLQPGESGSRRSVEFSHGFVRALQYSPDGSTLALGAYQSVGILNVATTEVRLLKGHRGYVQGVVFSPNGRQLATAAEDETARIWSLPDGDEVHSFTGHRLPATAIAFSGDGALVASSDGDVDQPRRKGTVHLWDTKTGNPLRTLTGHSRGVNCVVFSHDGQQVITGSADETICVWNTADGMLLKTLEGHSRPVNALALSPDGKWLASGGGGRFKGMNNVKLWNTSSWEELATIKAHDARVTGVGFSPDGQRLVSSSYDKTVKLWDLSGLNATPKQPPADE